MQPCAFCQAPLAPGEYICQRCGQMQPTEQLNQQTMMAESFGAPGPYSSQPMQPNLPPPPPPPGAWGLAEQSSPTIPGTMASGLWSPGSAPYPPAGTGPQAGAPFGWTPPPQYPGGPGYPGNMPMMGAAVGWAPPNQPGSTPVYPGQTGAPPKKGRALKIAAIVLAALIVLGGGGAAAFLLTRPKPTITVTGPQQSSSHVAGTPDQAFHVAGQDFSSNSPITFYLDGKSAPGAPKVTSDGSGNFSVDLPITDDWLLGSHTLTAEDASSYATKTGVQVVVLAAPVLSLTSQYQQGSAPAGANGTTFDVSGKRFAYNSAITFLLDGSALQNATPITSDAHGKVQVTVTVGNWAQGTHTITAQDAAGNVTKAGASIAIVAPGVAHTPGPNGAPPDDGVFGVTATVTAKDTSGQDISFQQFLSVTGQPDPAGGTVCDARDDGQPHTYNGTLGGSNVTYTETVTFSCSGTYKSGHLTYTETALTDVFDLSDGSRCAARGAYIAGKYDGTFSDPSTISGTYHRDAFNAPCNASSQFSSIFRNAGNGTWTGSK